MRLLLPLVALCCYWSLTAQHLPIEAILQEGDLTDIMRFDTATLAPNQYFVALKYASRQPLNLPDHESWHGARLLRIDLVYTDFPKGNRRRQQALNRQRLLELERRMPGRLRHETESWGFIRQTNCHTEAEARALPHGFLLTYSDKDELPDFTDATQLVELTEGDSTIFHALGRNTSWHKMLVVTDLTGSMSPYTAQLLLWFMLAENTGRVEHIIFFNDGDDKPDAEKIIGNTGGVYHTQTKSFEAIAELANRVVERGTGGDEPENNLEALLYGLKICPECEDIIMIADNWATPRDLVLIDQVNKPVRIILCGTDNGINPAYLNLARSTGGSVHTIEDDLDNLINLNEGQEMKIGREIFVIRKGKFELLKKI